LSKAITEAAERRTRGGKGGSIDRIASQGTRRFIRNSSTRRLRKKNTGGIEKKGLDLKTPTQKKMGGTVGEK